MLHEQPAQTQLEATTAHAMLASLVMGGLAVSYGGTIHFFTLKHVTG